MDRDQILTALRERILAFATSRVSRDHAEDLTQDVLAVLHDKYSQVAELVELVPLGFQVDQHNLYVGLALSKAIVGVDERKLGIAMR